MNLGSNGTRTILFSAVLLAACIGQYVSAADFTVSNDNSTGTGSFDQALQDVNQAGVGPHRILFDSEFFNVARQIHIDGRYAIVNELTITGPGSDLLTVIVAPRDINNAITRDLFVGDWAGNSPPTLTVEGMSIEIGPATGLTKRLFFLTNIDLFLYDVQMTGNSQPLTAQSGNGIVIQRATLFMQDSRMSGFAADANGGAVYVRNDNTESVIIERSVLTDNATTIGVPGTGYGGGIYVQGTGPAGSTTNLTLIDSEISDTVAEHSGGGIALFGEVRLTVHNSTISSNTASTGAGGGIYQITNGPLNIQFSTIVDNFTPGEGAGIYADRPNAIVRVTNSVVAGNFGGGTGNEITADVVASHSLIGDGPGDADIARITEDSGFSGTLIFDTDPMIAGLANTGGSSRTHALLAASPLIDAGSVNAEPREDSLPVPQTDQRGTGFARVSGSAPDIGAYELQVAPAPPPATGGSGGGGGGSSAPWMLLVLAGLAWLRRRTGVHR